MQCLGEGMPIVMAQRLALPRQLLGFGVYGMNDLISLLSDELCLGLLRHRGCKALHVSLALRRSHPAIIHKAAKRLISG